MLSFFSTNHKELLSVFCVTELILMVLSGNTLNIESLILFLFSLYQSIVDSLTKLGCHSSQLSIFFPSLFPNSLLQAKKNLHSLFQHERDYRDPFELKQRFISFHSMSRLVFSAASSYLFILFWGYFRCAIIYISISKFIYTVIQSYSNSNNKIVAGMFFYCFQEILC